MKYPIVTNQMDLNSGQLEILKILYSFRFITTELLSKYGNKSRQYSDSRLQTLEKNGYIGRNYSSDYKIRQKPASYYLTPKGIHILKQLNFEPKILKNIYGDRRASERFITHNLTLLNLYCYFMKIYRSDFEFFVRNELYIYNYFPDPNPDAFMFLRDRYSKLKYYFIDAFEETTPSFVIKKRIHCYRSYNEIEVWKEETGTRMPAIIFACETPELNKRISKHLNSSTIGNLEILLINKS